MNPLPDKGLDVWRGIPMSGPYDGLSAYCATVEPDDGCGGLLGTWKDIGAFARLSLLPIGGACSVVAWMDPAATSDSDSLFVADQVFQWCNDGIFSEVSTDAETLHDTTLATIAINRTESVRDDGMCCLDVGCTRELILCQLGDSGVPSCLLDGKRALEVAKTEDLCGDWTSEIAITGGAKSLTMKIEKGNPDGAPLGTWTLVFP